MKKNLLVTLADQNYVNQAKHFFARAYFYSGWQGDYMLLANDISSADLAWFEQKGILVYHCQPLTNAMPGRWPPAVLSKFYLFTSEFKKWDKIIYGDADLVIDASLDLLLETKTFAAISLNYFSTTPLAAYIDFSHPNFSPSLFLKIKKQFDLNRAGFSGGLFCLPTDLITDEMFDQLKSYLPLLSFCRFGEELALNLLFFNRWQKISFLYCLMPDKIARHCQLRATDIQGIVFHFDNANQPWVAGHAWHSDWQETVQKSASMDLAIRLPAKKVWTSEAILSYQQYLTDCYRRRAGRHYDFFKRVIRRSIRRLRIWLIEYFYYFKKSSVGERYVSLTFDDGLIDSAHQVDILLNPDRATFYLVTGWVRPNKVQIKDHYNFNQDHGSLTDWMMLGAKGHEIGSHSYSHPTKAVGLNSFELETSLEFIKKIKPQPPYSFSSPYNQPCSLDTPYDAVRIGDGRNIFNDLGNLDWAQLNSWDPFSERFFKLWRAAKKIKQTPDRSWVILRLHGLNGQGYHSLTSRQFQQLLKIFRQNNFSVVTVEGMVKKYKSV